MWLGLVDIIFAFAYDNRITEGENNVREREKYANFAFANYFNGAYFHEGSMFLKYKSIGCVG